MRIAFSVLAALVCAGSACAAEFENRWVYFTTPMTDDANVREAEKVIASAKANGLNGFVLACGLEFFSCWPGDRLPRLRAIQKLCEEAGLEIVPSMFSLGYGSMCNYGISLLEGVPVEGWTYVAKGGRLVPAEARPVDVGKVDRQIEHSMNRLLVGKVPVKDKARYRLSCRMRTKDFSAKRDLQLWALESGRKEFILLASRSFKFKPTQDWTLCEVEFNVPEDVTALSLYAGCQGGYQSGELDLEGFKLEQVAPVAVLKRDTAPVVARNAKTGRAYAADRDFTVPKCSRAGADHGEPVKPTEFPIPEGSSIREGDVVTLDCYVLAVVDGAQVSTCLSEPALYGYIEKSVRKVEELLSPKKWQISIDEFRNGGTCAGCKARGLTMAQMYGDAVTKIHDYILAAHPGAEVHMWSDMLDPGHNGIERYYNCRGSFKDAWKYVPKDIVVDCWYGEKSETSLRFFEQKGFRTFAAAYYDEKPPFEHARRWRDAARVTKGCTGWMYTTWRKAYGDLPAFCKLMNAESDVLNKERANR